MFTRARLVLAVWFTLALALTFVAVGGLAYWLIRGDLDSEINDSLRTTRAVFQGPGDGMPQRDRFPERMPPGVPADVFVVYTAQDGEVIANFRRVDVTDVNFARLCEDAGAGEAWNDVSPNGEHYRFLSFRDDEDSHWVHIGRSLEARDRQLRTLTMVFGVGGVAGVAAAAAGGLWLAGRALRPIKESFEAQRRFVSDASHELRTPLAVLRANGELLQRHPNDTIAANMDQVEAITSEAEAMTRLVEDLLTLARADEGRATVAHEEVALGAVIEELGRDMEALAASRGIDLRVDAAPAQVNGDRLRLRQLGAILLDNALKYTPRGGRVTLRCTHHGRTVELSVADSGPGIPPDQQARVFDRFVRLDDSRTRAAGGTGLGLAIAKWIAEAHGGRISVESQPGQGARFTVRLPAAD